MLSITISSNFTWNHRTLFILQTLNLKYKYTFEHIYWAMKSTSFLKNQNLLVWNFSILSKAFVKGAFVFGSIMHHTWYFKRYVEQSCDFKACILKHWAKITNQMQIQISKNNNESFYKCTFQIFDANIFLYLVP